MRLSIIWLLGLSGCAYAAASALVPGVVLLAVPGGHVEPGDGSDEAARKQIAERKDAAIAEATRDAIAAADRAPQNLRLQRRAVAMVGALAGHGDGGKRAIAALPIEPLFARLVQTEPCPGLADVAGAYRALGEPGRAGDNYLRAARTCGSVEAAVAAVAPLRQAERCDDAVGILRVMWPHVEVARRDQWIAVFDGVAACSDALTLRRNLSFAPEDIVADYLDLLAAREREAREAERRAEAERAAQEASDRAREATWQCQSECGAAVSSCESSCSGDAGCLSRCSSVGHACRAGCGG